MSGYPTQERHRRSVDDLAHLVFMPVFEILHVSDEINHGVSQIYRRDDRRIGDKGRSVRFGEYLQGRLKLRDQADHQPFSSLAPPTR
jgi:hypothetical protein